MLDYGLCPFFDLVPVLTYLEGFLGYAAGVLGYLFVLARWYGHLQRRRLGGS